MTTHDKIVAACQSARESTMRALAHIERIEDHIKNQKKQLTPSEFLTKVKDK